MFDEMPERKLNFGKVQNPLCVCLQCSLTSLGGSGLEREIDLVEIPIEMILFLF